jgi:hypothetical protein
VLRIVLLIFIIFISNPANADSAANKSPTLNKQREAENNSGTVIDWITVVISIVGIGGVWYQIRIANTQMRRDHERRKVEATLSAVRHANQLLLKCDQTLLDKSSVERAIDADSSDEALNLLNALDEMEFMAVGFHSKAYHLGTGLMMLGTWYSDMVEVLKPLIEAQRNQKKRPTLYTETQRLAEKFKKLAGNSRTKNSYSTEILTDLDR